MDRELIQRNTRILKIIKGIYPALHGYIWSDKVSVKIFSTQYCMLYRLYPEIRKIARKYGFAVSPFPRNVSINEYCECYLVVDNLKWF